MSRLKQTDWIAAGFRALTAKGPQALKAEPLARELVTTKGSFYWHFKDVPAFQAAMLEFWEARATQDIINLLAELPSAEAKLRMLSKVATTPQTDFGGVGAEPALRAWAKADARVSEALGRVDAARLAYLDDILGQMGMGNPDLPRLFYASLIGLQELGCIDKSITGAPLGTLADLMIALAETD